jgi:hypothetical protein
MRQYDLGAFFFGFWFCYMEGWERRGGGSFSYFVPGFVPGFGFWGVR